MADGWSDPLLQKPGFSAPRIRAVSHTLPSWSSIGLWMGGFAEAFVDDLVLETYDTYGVYHINDNAGNIEIQTGDDTTDADDEDDQVADWADAATHVLEVRVATDGAFTFYIDGAASTVTTATGAAAAGDILIPVIGLLNDSDADTNTKVNWIEIGEVV